MYILVNSGDLKIKLDLYYMRTCVSFITANNAINKVNVTLQQHETLRDANKNQIQNNQKHNHSLTRCAGNQLEIRF